MSFSKKIGPLEVQDNGRQNTITTLLLRFHKGQKSLVAFANTNLVTWAHRRSDLRTKLKKFIILNDGIGLNLGNFLVNGGFFKENLNGTDFTPLLLKKMPRKTKVFLYGSRPGVAVQAGKILEKECGVRIVGSLDGYTHLPIYEILNSIRKSQASVVLVGLGNPLQELWIDNHKNELHAPLIIGVGALFDFVSGHIRRAPLWVRSLHLEWLYRLVGEPQRLAKRYTIDILYFLYIAVYWRFTSISRQP